MSSEEMKTYSLNLYHLLQHIISQPTRVTEQHFVSDISVICRKRIQMQTFISSSVQTFFEKTTCNHFLGSHFKAVSWLE